MIFNIRVDVPNSLSNSSQTQKYAEVWLSQMHCSVLSSERRCPMELPIFLYFLSQVQVQHVDTTDVNNIGDSDIIPNKLWNVISKNDSC